MRQNTIGIGVLLILLITKVFDKKVVKIFDCSELTVLIETVKSLLRVSLKTGDPGDSLIVRII